MAFFSQFDPILSQSSVVTKRRNELQWPTMSYNDLQWATMTYNELQWATTINHNDLQWATMSYNDLQWAWTTYNELQWPTKSYIYVIFEPEVASIVCWGPLTGVTYKGVRCSYCKKHFPRIPNIVQGVQELPSMFYDFCRGRGVIQDTTCLIPKWTFYIRCAWSLHCWRNGTRRFESFS